MTLGKVGSPIRVFEDDIASAIDIIYILDIGGNWVTFFYTNKVFSKTFG